MNIINIKKLTAIVLALLLCIMCLMSCAREYTGAGPDFSTLPDDYNGGKRVINLTALENNYAIRQHVEAFNRVSDKYVVNLRYYVDMDSQENWFSSFENERDRFNTELIAGYIPDIILCDDFLSVQGYINHGMFADLYTFMEADPDFDINNYLVNFFTATEQDGKLYEISPCFSVQTMYMKTTDAQDIQDWSAYSFFEFISSRPDLEHIIVGFTRQNFIVEMILRLFIEKDSMNVSIDRDALSRLFEIAERFPLEPPQDVALAELGMRDGDPVINAGYINSPRSIRVFEQVYAGGDVTLIGYPRADDSPSPSGSLGCSYFNSFPRYAIMDNAAEKDGAWEFIKFVLDYENSDLFNAIPVNLSLLDNMMALAKEDYHGEEYVMSIFVEVPEDAPDADDNMRIMTMDEFGNIITSSAAVIDIPVGNNTDEDNAKFLEFIQSVNNVQRYDTAISNIVSEEIDGYFSGHYTVEQVASAIESRVNLYLGEMG